MSGSVRSISHPPQIQFDSANDRWNFEPFVAWLKEQGVFKEFDANHMHGPNIGNQAAVDAINESIDLTVTSPHESSAASSQRHVRLPRYAGDGILASSKSHFIKTKNIPDAAATVKFRTLVFASYAGMLDKILNPEILQPYMDHAMKDVDIHELKDYMALHDWGALTIPEGALSEGNSFSITTPREPKVLSRIEDPVVKEILHNDPAAVMSVICYFKALNGFMAQLKDAIRQSDLDEKEKEIGSNLCDGIMENGLQVGTTPLVKNLNSAIGLACAVNHEYSGALYRNEEGLPPKTTRDDFNAAMRFIHTQGFFKNGKTRCPGESAVLKLSGRAAGEMPDGKYNTTFGNRLYDCCEHLRKQIAADPSLESQLKKQTEDPLFRQGVGGILA